MKPGRIPSEPHHGTPLVIRVIARDNENVADIIQECSFKISCYFLSPQNTMHISVDHLICCSMSVDLLVHPKWN